MIAEVERGEDYLKGKYEAALNDTELSPAALAAIRRPSSRSAPATTRRARSSTGWRAPTRSGACPPASAPVPAMIRDGRRQPGRGEAMTERAEVQTDAAALGGGVVAIAMTMFSDPTPYDILSLVVAATLILLILGYIGGHPRAWPQRLAYAAVLGIIFVPVWGYVAESWKLPVWTDGRPPQIDAAVRFARDHAAEPTFDALASYSTVSDFATVVAWALASHARLRRRLALASPARTRPRRRSLVTVGIFSPHSILIRGSRGRPSISSVIGT